MKTFNLTATGDPLGEIRMVLPISAEMESHFIEAANILERLSDDGRPVLQMQFYGESPAAMWDSDGCRINNRVDTARWTVQMMPRPMKDNAPVFEFFWSGHISGVCAVETEPVRLNDLRSRVMDWHSDLVDVDLIVRGQDFKNEKTYSAKLDLANGLVVSETSFDLDVGRHKRIDIRLPDDFSNEEFQLDVLGSGQYVVKPAKYDELLDLFRNSDMSMNAA